MDAAISQDPLLLVVLGFSLAMAVVIALLVIFRAGQAPTQGVVPTSPVVYPIEDPRERMGSGCFLILLFVVVIAILLVLSSA